MIAVDVMGGDFAPDVVLQGAVAAAQKSIPVTLFGPYDLVYQWLTTRFPSWHTYPITIVDAPQQIAMDEESVAAVRSKTQSSLVKAVASVASKECSAVISAGNSGALMVASALIIGMRDGINRPAIAGFLPTSGGHPVLALDLGANTECRPNHLYQFAHLGSEYVANMVNKPAPLVGLLSNGHEAGKGSVLTKETYALLKGSSLNFYGNVEPYDLFQGKVDVVVCDGFAGNVMLKTMESVVSLCILLDSSLKGKIADKGMHTIRGGAPLLGVKGCVIVCHGGASAQDIEDAISMAYNTSKGDERSKTLILPEK